MAVGHRIFINLEIQSKSGAGFNLYRLSDIVVLQGEIRKYMDSDLFQEPAYSNSQKTCYGFVLLLHMEGYTVVI